MDIFCLDFNALSLSNEDPVKWNALLNKQEVFEKLPQYLLCDPLFFTRAINVSVQENKHYILEYYAHQDTKYLQEIMLASIELKNFAIMEWCKQRIGRLDSLILNKAFETRDSKLVSILFS